MESPGSKTIVGPAGRIAPMTYHMTKSFQGSGGTIDQSEDMINLRDLYPVGHEADGCLRLPHSSSLQRGANLSSNRRPRCIFAVFSANGRPPVGARP
jgi:hypothetical protein